MSSLRPLALCLALCAAATLAAGATASVGSKEIVVGHDVDLSGTIAVRMKPLVQAADFYLERVNAGGGVHGRQIRVLRTDSANKPEKTKDNVKALVERDGVFAMWAISGTGNVAVALPYLEQQKVPLIGSTSGADAFYSKTHPMLINVKAGYSDEIRRMTTHMRETYVNKVAILYLDNGFGREALKSALAAAKQNQLEVLGVAGFKEDGSDIVAAVGKIAAVDPPAVLLLTLAGPAPKLVEAYVATGKNTQFFALSIIATEALYKAVGDKARGIIVTQIVPFPWDRSIPLVKEYQDLLRSRGVTEYSPAGMEGYILAKALVEGLRAAGANPTRAGLLEAFEKMHGRDLGGMTLDYGANDHNGSDLVEITMISRDGRLLR